MLGRSIQRSNPFPCTLVASYSNGSFAYSPSHQDMEELEGLPFREWIDQEKYRWAYGATITTRVANEAGEMVVEATAGMLNQAH
jgi:hypothetical protein